VWVGQPRTGDAAYADLVEDLVGRDFIFRGKFLILRNARYGQMSLIVLYSGTHLGCFFSHVHSTLVNDLTLVRQMVFQL